MMEMAFKARERVLREVDAELACAMVKFPPFNTPHEGYAVLLEEMDELWDEVKRGKGYEPALRREAIQVAAMAVRFVFDLTDGGEG